MSARSLLATAALLAACSEVGEGQVTFQAWGEEAPVEGFSSSDLADGWAVTFDRWLTAFGEPTLVSADDGSDIARDDRVWVADWTRTVSPVDLTELTAPARRHDVAFSVMVPPADAVALEGVSEDDVALLRDNGWTHWIEGSATDGTDTYTFGWELQRQVRLVRCESGRDGNPGVAVPAEGNLNAVLTLHADHLLWDQLGTEEADMRFGPLTQADANGDQHLSMDELAALNVSDIGYETAGIDIEDSIQAFIEFSVAIGMHLDGDGLCVVTRRL